MKAAHRSRRGRSQSNRSLLMMGIIVLDCALLFLCIFVCGLLMTIGR
jgi:hypothetical protein